jgi:hypothetical protein
MATMAPTKLRAPPAVPVTPGVAGEPNTGTNGTDVFLGMGHHAYSDGDFTNNDI